MGEVLLLLARNLALTILIEGIVAFVIHRRIRILYPTLLCNLATNPALNFLLLIVNYVGADAMPPWVYPVTLAVLEASAVLVEMRILRLTAGLTKPQALLTSLIMNAVSWSTGALIFG